MSIAGQLIELNKLLSFNKAIALERVGGDTELLREVAQLYLGEYPGLLTQMRSALDARDPDRLQRAAHTLKGSLGTLGAERALRFIIQLETMGRTGNLDGCESAYSDLEAALGNFHRELEAV